jgi:hypothetical protein
MWLNMKAYGRAMKNEMTHANSFLHFSNLEINSLVCEILGSDIGNCKDCCLLECYVTSSRSVPDFR